MTYDEFRSQLAVLICDLDHGILPAADLAHRASVLVSADASRARHDGMEPRLDPADRARINASSADLRAANPDACAAQRTWLQRELRYAFESITTPESVR